MYEYLTSGVCAKAIKYHIEDSKVKNVEFIGGCNGNLKGIGKLVENMDIEEVINKLSGIKCGIKSTSCPDQLSKALSKHLIK